MTRRNARVTIRWLFVTLLMFSTVVVSGKARADDHTHDNGHDHTHDGAWVCDLMEQGMTVPQIVDLLQGDPRVARLHIEDAVWIIVKQDCPPDIQAQDRSGTPGFDAPMDPRNQMGGHNGR